MKLFQWNIVYYINYIFLINYGSLFVILQAVETEKVSENEEYVINLCFFFLNTIYNTGNTLNSWIKMLNKITIISEMLSSLRISWPLSLVKILQCWLKPEWSWELVSCIQKPEFHWVPKELSLITGVSSSANVEYLLSPHLFCSTKSELGSCLGFSNVSN